MLHTKKWKFIVIQKNYKHYHFVVHIQGLMAQGGWVSIIIWVFIPKIGHIICVIRRIPCTCVARESMLDKPCISGIPSKKYSCYQYVTDCSYWPVLVSFNNWNDIHMSPKSTTFETFEETHQVVFDGISDNMASWVKYNKYGAINTADTKNGFYVIKFI